MEAGGSSSQGFVPESEAQKEGVHVKGDHQTGDVQVGYNLEDVDVASGEGDGFNDFAGDGEALEAGARLVEEFESDTSGIGGEGLPPSGLQVITIRERPIGPIKQEVVAQVGPAGREHYLEQFDVVCGHSDHVYANYKPPDPEKPTKMSKLLSKLHITNSSSEKRPDTGPSPGWAKRIQQEWRSLEKDLPEGGIFVRVYEERLGLLRAAIVGPAGTPYHDGLFFFDICFPPNYPNVPPEAWYKSYGIHMNPNLAKNGYVCLSLLGTWYGRGCEKWIPHKSTVLQLLVSIQALVLNSQPYFNEPSMVPFRSRLPHNKKLSLSYNETVFLRSLCTITWVLHKPPMHFKRFVESHFRSRGRAILLACKAYMEGAMVGSNDLSRRDGKSSSMEFRSQLKPYFDRLLRDFKAIGADCEGIAA